MKDDTLTFIMTICALLGKDLLPAHLEQQFGLKYRHAQEVVRDYRKYQREHPDEFSK